MKEFLQSLGFKVGEIVIDVIRDIDVRGISKAYVKEKVFFNSDDIQEYIEIFNELKNQNYLIANAFQDDQWTVPCGTLNSYLTLNFELDMYKKLKVAQKIYFLILIRKGKSSSYIKNYQKKLTDIMYKTEGLININSVEEYILNDKNKYSTARLILKFVEFYTELNTKAISQLCEKICEGERKNKDLPPFHEILTFDEIVNSFFNNYNIEYFKYRPIQLWWAITNIIPMRPVDFCRLKMDCLRKDMNGLYWITVTRSKKVKVSVHDIPPIQEIQITEVVFRLINEIRLDMIANGIKSEYLFSQQYFFDFCIKNKYKNKRIVVDRITTDQFRNLLNAFYEEIVGDLYGEIVTFKIVPSHTRHFAIINLFLQGFNLLSIAELAGHDNLHSPNNYYSHAKSFVESYVYNLNKSGLTNNVSRNFNDGLIGWRREVIDEGKIYNYGEAESLFLKVDYGFCKDTVGFPNNCCEDCRICRPYFIFKPSINEHAAGIKWLESYSEELSLEINEIVETMIAASKAISSHYTPDLNESLQIKSRQLQQRMDHKLAIEQQLMEDYVNE